MHISKSDFSLPLKNLKITVRRLVVATALTLLIPGLTLVVPISNFSSLGNVGVAFAKTKVPKKVTVTGQLGSTNGTFKGKGKSKVVVGSSKDFIATSKKGYKSAIVVNGKLAKFQTDKQAKAAQKKNAKKGANDLTYSLKKIKSDTLVKALFVKIGQSFAQGVGLSLSGLGATINITNLSAAPISGTAESDIGIKKIACINLTTGAKGTVQGTTNWTASIPFANGDNLIQCTLTAADGSNFSTETTVTHFPNIDFVGPLTLSDDILFLNEPKNIRALISLQESSAATVTLVSVNAAGQEDGATTVPMLDDGVLPDEIQKDGTFTGQTTLTQTQSGFLRFRVKVVKPTGTYFSEVHIIWVTDHLSQADLLKSVTLADSVEALYNSLIASKKNDSTAFDAIVAALIADPAIGAAGVGPLGGVWWITTRGILGHFTPDKAGKKGGGEPDPTRQALAKAIEANPVVENSLSATPYSQADSVWYSGVSGLPVPMAVTAAANRVKSKKAVIISPYIANPNYPGSSFGSNDDFSVPWQVVVNKGSACTIKKDAEIVNNGSTNVSLDTFKNLDPYGVIHISSHGDTVYNGLLSLWQDVWGPKGGLQGYFSLVIIKTGVQIPFKADGITFDTSLIEEDLLAKRVAVSSNRSVSILPSFVTKYVKQLPNSIVILSSCRSAWNASMANAFISKGAGAVFGYGDYVLTSYAQNTLSEVYTQLFNDKKTSEALSSAVTKFGATDTSTPPAKFVLFGAEDLQFPSGDLENGGFEDGALSPWEHSGDGRVISQLGGTAPTEGAKMGIISTGLGFTTSSGEVSQIFCPTANAQSLDLQWNFFSEEFKEYCGSIYQDFFSVQLCEVPDTGAEICTTVLSNTVDSLCSSVTASDIGFDQGGVFNTGWIPLSTPLTSYVGKKVRIKLSAGDVGDSIFDTAILLDNIQVIKAP